MGIYLAAGKSTRFENNKLFATFKNKPLGSIGLEAAIESKLDEIIIIIRPGDKLNWTTKQIKLSKTRWIKKECTEAYKGQSYSLKCGLTLAEKLGADAIVVLLADQPFVTPKFIDRLIESFYKNSKSYFIGTIGLICPPILISSNLFSKIYEIEGDRGASEIIQAEKKNGLFLKKDSHDLYTFFDVDTKTDFEKLKQLY